MSSDAHLIGAIDEYLDAAPRPAADTEEIGPFTLFRGIGPWRYYARPRLGATGQIGTADVLALRAAQRDLLAPEKIEWVYEVTPSLAESAEVAGLQVAKYPLMVLDPGAFTPGAPPEGVTLRILGEDDEAFEEAHAVAEVGFRISGTAVGSEGVDERRSAMLSTPAALTEFQRVRAREGWSISAAAFSEDGAVGVGTHQPVGNATEIVGVATLPSWRRRGIGAAVTSMLVADALVRGIDTIFLSAGSDDVARVYSNLGFRRVGSVGAAEPPQPPEA